MTARRYQAYLIGEGLLLGGVKTHVSSWFTSKAKAQKWLATVKYGNRAVGRVVARSGIIEKKGKGEI